MLVCMHHIYVHLVAFNREKWKDSSCTCWYFIKKYHIFVVAVNELKKRIPIKFKNVKIDQKTVVGRKL